MPGPWDRDDRIAFVPTSAEFDAAARLTVRRTAQQKMVAIVCAGTAAAEIAFARPDGFWPVFLLGAAAALLVMPMLYWLLRAAVGGPLARRVNARRWELDVRYEVRWTADGITVETDRMAMRLPWTIYVRRRETDTMILLYHSAR